MKCKQCNKDITSLYFFTRKEYCSEKCEKKNDNKETPEWLNNFFGGFKK